MKQGIQVLCRRCGRTKKPLGRDAPLSESYCDHDCPGYVQPPLPGILWPGEREDALGVTGLFLEHGVEEI